MNLDHPQRRPFFTATYLFATSQRASGLASDAPVTHEAESAAPRSCSNSLLVPEWPRRECGRAISLCTANHPCTLSLHEREKRRARKGRGSLVCGEPVVESTGTHIGQRPTGNFISFPQLWDHGVVTSVVGWVLLIYMLVATD